VLNAFQRVLLLLHLLTRSVSRGRDTNDSEYSDAGASSFGSVAVEATIPSCLKGSPFSASAIASAESASASP
jgi:hypothetical protein